MNDKIRCVEDFKQLKTRKDVANFLGISDKKLCYILYVKKPINFYTSFNIQKGNGAFREILAPQKELKYLQKLLNPVLMDLYLEKPKKSVTGFVRGKSIKHNASPHIGAKCILNIDFKDFFNQINFGRVLGMLQKGFGLEKEAAVIISQIVTVDNRLPQGAPTSPIITNLICSRMDVQLEKLARRVGIVYTRYADDLTFSTNKMSFPKIICEYGIQNAKVGEALETVFGNNKFIVNEQKVFLRSKRNRQEVTGLVVNEKMNVRREYIRTLRATLHSCSKTISQGNEIDNKIKYQLCGKLRYLKMIRGIYDNLYLKYALEYNKIFGDTFLEEERIGNFNEWIKKRVFVIDTYADGNHGLGNGTGFNLLNVGIVSCEHVISDIHLYELKNINIYYGDMETTEVPFTNSNLKFNNSKDTAIFKDTYSNNHYLEANFDFDFSSNEELTLIGYPNFDFYRSSPISISKTRTYNQRYTNGKFVYETDIPINHGMSGGPVLDKTGKVVGIITNGSSPGELESPIYGFISLHNIKSLLQNEKVK